MGDLLARVELDLASTVAKARAHVHLADAAPLAAARARPIRVTLSGPAQWGSGYHDGLLGIRLGRPDLVVGLLGELGVVASLDQAGAIVGLDDDPNAKSGKSGAGLHGPQPTRCVQETLPVKWHWPRAYCDARAGARRARFDAPDGPAAFPTISSFDPRAEHEGCLAIVRSFDSRRVSDLGHVSKHDPS